MNYYNDNDPYVAQWLRNLIQAGHIPRGDVDERDIADVKSRDLRGYVQCHFFAGIAGWPLALRMAGWPSERSLWTGSCPCQPFSYVGSRSGEDDPRHLWPEWFRLIRQCRPATIFGEQVAAAIGQGWLDTVFADLEKQGYACGAAVLPACSVGAPHIRQRLWFVADAAGIRCNESARSGETSQGRQADTQSKVSRKHTQGFGRCSRAGKLDDAAGQQVGRAGQPWKNCSWLPCADGKARPVEPDVFPLAHGVSARMGKLRAAGNAIVPQVAAQFVRAAMEIAS